MRQMMWNVLSVIVLGASACGYAVPSRSISADIDASLWNGPTSVYPGRTLDLRDEPKGVAPWRHIDSDVRSHNNLQRFGRLHSVLVRTAAIYVPSSKPEKRSDAMNRLYKSFALAVLVSPILIVGLFRRPLPRKSHRRRRARERWADAAAMHDRAMVERLSAPD